MLPPPSHFEHKHKKIYSRTLFLSYMATGSSKRQKILGNQNSLCKNVFENVFQSVAILWQLLTPSPPKHQVASKAFPLDANSYKRF